MEWPEMVVRNVVAVTRRSPSPTPVDHDWLGVRCGHDLTAADAAAVIAWGFGASSLG
jgi:hypothetical protein